MRNGFFCDIVIYVVCLVLVSLIAAIGYLWNILVYNCQSYALDRYDVFFP